MRSHTFAAVLLACLLAACATPRSYVEISGSVQLPRGASLPDSYRLFLIEQRHEQSVLAEYLLPVAALEVGPSGTFQFEGYVCPTEVWLEAPYAGGIRVSSPSHRGIMIDISTEELAIIQAEYERNPAWQLQLERAAEFEARAQQTRNSAQIPC